MHFGTLGIWTLNASFSLEICYMSQFSQRRPFHPVMVPKGKQKKKNQ